MARITVEDCLTKETNRFGLVLLAARRTKQILGGSKLAIPETKNKSVVNSLREIAKGKVRFMTDEELRLEEERVEQERLAKLAAAEAAATPPPSENGSSGKGDSTDDEAAVDAKLAAEGPDSLFNDPVAVPEPEAAVAATEVAEETASPEVVETASAAEDTANVAKDLSPEVGGEEAVKTETSE